MIPDKMIQAAAARAAQRARSFEDLPIEALAVLADLREAWFPLGKTEDYATVRSLMLRAYGQ